MNQSLGFRDEHPPKTLEDAPQSVFLVRNLLRQIQADTNLALDFSNAFELREFQLGEQLADYSAASENSVDHEQSNGDFFLVCQGRVRLLSFDPKKQREVSTGVLEVGETFGAEILFTNELLLTRAVAASEVQVTQMPLKRLETWLEQIPNLRDYLYQQAMQRQWLLFCKTATELRSLTSHQLQQLLPYLVEKRVNKGELLIQATPPDVGRFWLRSGKIQSQLSEYPPPTVGQSWGYPDPMLSDWIAQSDLLVYHLPRENWEVACAIAPVLASKPIVGTNSVKATSNGLQRPKASTVAVNKSLPAQYPGNHQRLRKSPQSDSVTNGSQAKSEPIIFPQPSNRLQRSRSFWQGYPFIQQQSSSDCGATCLAMIGKYWGKQFGLNYLRELAGVGRAGSSLKGLAKAAESLGFQARPVRASLSSVELQTKPWIAHWQGDHYVVVYRKKGDRLLIADPAMGKRSLSRQEFQANWTGYALLLDPTERLEAAQTEKNSLSRFWRVLFPYRSLIWQIVLASLLIQIFGLITPLFTQVILDSVVVNKSFLTLHVFAIGLLIFGVWRIGLVAVRQYLLDYFSNRIDLTLIGGFISHALMLPLKFFESRHVGDIITRIQENQKIQVFLTRQAVLAWLDALMGIVYIGLMLYYNWRLTALVLGLIPPIAILTVAASPLLRKVSREIFNEAAGQNSSVVEMLTGVATVKATAAERELRWRWEDRLTSTLNARFRGQKLANTLQVASGLINIFGSTALLWYGAMLVIQGELTIGQFVAFNMMIGNVISPVLALVGLWDDLQEIMVSVERLNDVFSAQPEESLTRPMMVMPWIQGEVRFDNVTFRYDQNEERNTLQNISFEVHPGQTVAIVGRSGSGKSTLVSLMQALYYPSSGRILIDGHDIRHVSPQSFRSQLGVVPQECFLFSGTIAENITLYRPEFSLEQTVKVAKLAEAHTFIQDLPLGYNTIVGERGSTLSGGQRQRIAIARALIGDPRILILDEATSSLDTESERRFQQNLARISRERTTFIIAHRLSTVRHADYILVLNKGIVAERGTHNELIANQGIYSHLAQQQLVL